MLAHNAEEDQELQEQYHENLLADHYRSMGQNDPSLCNATPTATTTSSSPLDRAKLEESLGAAFECGYSPESSEYGGTMSVWNLDSWIVFTHPTGYYCIIIGQRILSFF